MKKILLLSLIFCLFSTVIAKPVRFKFGICDYSPVLKEFNTKNGIYRLNGRLDLLNLSSRLGLGTAMNISFKSDNHDVDYYNNYDFYVHNLYGNKSREGKYIIYGLTAGMRITKVKTVSPDYYDKVTYTFSSFLLGAMVSRNDWGLEIVCSQNEENNLKLDFATKYQFSHSYYLEAAYCYIGPVKEIEEDFSITFGMEFFSN